MTETAPHPCSLFCFLFFKIIFCGYLIRIGHSFPLQYMPQMLYLYIILYIILDDDDDDVWHKIEATENMY